MFIYKITNLINGKNYIGLDSGPLDEMRRWNNDHSKIYKTSNACRKLYSAMRKHGLIYFKCDIIDKAETMDVLRKKEEYWIKHYDSCKNGYNIVPSSKGGWTYDELSEEDKKQKKKDCSRGAYIANKNRWEHASDVDRKTVAENMKAGYKDGERSKIVKENWSKLSDEERYNKTNGIRKYWKSLSSEEKKQRCSTHTNGNPKSYKITDPNGNSFVIKGLKQFCKDNDLSLYYMGRVLKNKIDNHKGWKIDNT